VHHLLFFLDPRRLVVQLSGEIQLKEYTQ
jgi:hypothetical protein